MMDVITLAIDWPSFGYGAGALAVVTSYWRERDTGFLRHQVANVIRRRAQRRFHRATGAREIAALDRQVKSLERDSEKHLGIAQQLVAHLASAEAREQKVLSAHARAEKQIGELQAALERAKLQDVKWAAYQARKKGLPVGPGAASKSNGLYVQVPTATNTVTIYTGSKATGENVVTAKDNAYCACSHHAKDHSWIEPEPCHMCGCTSYSTESTKSWFQRRTGHQRLDGQGWAGKPGTHCGRSACCLGDGHDGDCTT